MRYLKQLLIALCLCIGFISQSFAQPIGSPMYALRIGIGLFYPPFESTSAANQSYGFDVEVVQAICKKINTQCVFVTMPLSNMIPSLNNDTVDAVVGAISITPARLEKIDFTSPYYANTASFVGTTSTNINTAQLQNVSVGAAQGTTFVNYLQALYPGKINVKVYPTTEDVIEALSQKKVQLIMLDTPVAQYWVNNGAAQFKIIGNPLSDQQFLGIGYGIAVKKGNAQLLDALNYGLMAIKQDGTLAAITNKYFMAL